LNIAILGANGFLGQHLTTTLIASGNEVTGFVLNPKLTSNFGYREMSIRELLHGSQTNFERFDVAINLAAKRSTKAQPYSDSEVMEYTFQIPYNFFLRTVTSSTLLINASTYIQNHMGIIGNTIDTYSFAKQKLSESLENLVGIDGFTILDLFFFTLYGPRDRSSHLIPLLLEAARSNQSIDLSPGKQLINLLFVDDAVENIVNLLNTKEALGYRKYHVWSEELKTIREVVADIENSLGVTINSNWGAREYSGHEMLSRWKEVTELVPSFSASTSFKEGIHYTWAGMQKK
jgi:CDP-3, 6-dideoxy-D-glycero-L-glycero-4-hexulose-4-reductase